MNATNSVNQPTVAQHRKAKSGRLQGEKSQSRHSSNHRWSSGWEFANRSNRKP